MPLDSSATPTTATNSATYLANSRLRVPEGRAGAAPGAADAASVRASGVSGWREMLIARNLARRRRLVSCRTAKGSFDNLVGPREQHRRDVQAERFRGLEVDDEFELRWLLDGQIPRLRAMENPVNEGSRPEIEVRITHPIGYQSTGFDELLGRI